ncbi:hypothetical protein [Maridesulfovibrio bastinii]|uniref:hypothetical protein n=1 Tax=Maridesulfovibrio bastinii TaxID=47157 RepID=UPI0003FD41F3|nr:hypothetical protein [Maridesulfovibrio bastinii]
MSKTKYNVLFMRDDDTVKRYRLSPVLLKFFLWFLIVMIACAGGGAWAGYTFWKSNKELKKDKITLRQELNKSAVQLERLQNVNKILDSYDPNELQSLLTAVPLEEKKVEPKSRLNLSKLLNYKNLMRAGVENIKLRKSGNGLALSLDLNNLQTSSSLNGLIGLELVLNDGEVAKVKSNHDDLSFQIQRFKVVRTRFPFPGDVDLKDIYGLRLKINTSDHELIFSEVYPISGIYN